ncbi:hypothetical protein AAVH_32646, partial [Aphelenchoides avenae]
MVAVKSSRHKDDYGLKMALIKEVKKFPCLYDDAQPQVNAAQRSNCWPMICTGVGVKEKDLVPLKNLWRDLRDSFRRCRRQEAAGKAVVWEFWQAMAWYAPFQPLNQDGPPQKKVKREAKKEEAPSYSNVPSDGELDVGEPPQQQYVEEVVYVEPAADPRMDQLLEQLQKHLSVDSTPNVHMGHALGQRMDRNIPVELQDDAWAAIFGVLKEFEEKPKASAAPTLTAATG